MTNELNDMLGRSGQDDEDPIADIPQFDALTAPPPRREPPPRVNAQPRVEVQDQTISTEKAADGRETAEEAAARIRAQRDRGELARHLNGFTKKLEVRYDMPGWTLKIIADDQDRLDMALQHGYAFVESDEVAVNRNVASYNTDVGSRVRFVLGSKEGGGVLYGYLMKIPDAIHEDDMEAMEEQNARIDEGIRQGVAPGESKNVLEARYIMGNRRENAYNPRSAKTYRQRKG